jgi:hypothetical protein
MGIRQMGPLVVSIFFSPLHPVRFTNVET